MKRKADFITNSSSCAFIFIGWKLEQTTENAMKIANLYNINTQVGDSPIEIMEDVGDQVLDIQYGELVEQGLKSDHIYIGISHDIDEDDPYEFPIENSAESLFDDKVLGIFKKEDIKIITSIRMC